MPRASETDRMILEVKEGLSSLCGECGAPSQGIVVFRSTFATSVAFSTLVGKASIHPVSTLSSFLEKYTTDWGLLPSC